MADRLPLHIDQVAENGEGGFASPAASSVAPNTITPKTLATATVDRLLLHAHLVITKGDSHRLAEAVAGKGVIPLS